jgi:hypothetical protein
MINERRCGMKKKLMVLLVLAMSLSLAGSALAATFPGATVGFQWQNNLNVYTILTLKVNGTAKMASPIKFYTVSGVTFDTTNSLAQYPVSGTAYVKGPAGSQILFFSLSGTLALTGQFIDLEGAIYQTAGTGDVYVRASQDNAWGNQVNVHITMLTAAQIKALNFP